VQYNHLNIKNNNLNAIWDEPKGVKSNYGEHKMLIFKIVHV
jgi:hypothetical protein